MQTPNLIEYSKRRIRENMPFPKKDADKYSRGVLTIIGGSSSYPGAACMATDAAFMMGAGYVNTICAPTTVPIVQAHNIEAVVDSWDGWKCEGSRLALSEPKHTQACLIGCGTDPVKDDVIAGLLFDVLDKCDHPVVVDGGAISMLATDEGRSLVNVRAARGASTIITPHFGEAVRLAKPIALSVPADPDSENEACGLFARELACAYASTVVLKGSNTYIALAEHERIQSKQSINDSTSTPSVYIMRKGTSALAKAGTGDVLAGMVSSLLAQGSSPEDAANIAVSVHARSGREAAHELTKICVRAQDVIKYLPSAISYFMD